VGACCDYAQKYFTGANVDIAASVCMGESSDNPNAANPNGCCHGLMQINLPAHPDFDASRRYDPDYNMAYAAKLQAEQGWGPWEAYTNGSYQKYLGRCGGSSSPVGSSPLVPPSGHSALVLGGLLLAGLLILEEIR
jgi:hypothetical protein